MQFFFSQHKNSNFPYFWKQKIMNFLFLKLFAYFSIFMNHTQRFQIIWLSTPWTVHTISLFFVSSLCIFHQLQSFSSRFCDLNGTQKSYSYTQSANLVLYKCRLINYHYNPICCVIIFIKVKTVHVEKTCIHQSYKRVIIVIIEVHLICNRTRTHNHLFFSLYFSSFYLTPFPLQDMQPNKVL